jgi:signal transduction histidine kinase
VIPQDIGRVLLNLINNAFQAVQEKSHTETEGYQPMVKVSTQLTHSSQEGLPAGLAGAGGVLITISDNGPGIHDEIKDKIFQPFFTTKPTGQGTGLGLSLAYDIVKAHGGEIIVESNINHGTEFFVKITDTPKTNT